MTFKNSKIVYYGPHACENCGAMIVKMGHEWGGTAFTNPNGPIYPNTEWHPHVCDPALVKQRIGSNAALRVKQDWPQAITHPIGKMGYVILAEPALAPNDPHALVISECMTFHGSEESAWGGALRRQQEHLPTWHLNLGKYSPDAHFGDDLDRLPEMPA